MIDCFQSNSTTLFQLDNSTLTDHEVCVDNELAGCGVAYLNVLSMTYSAGSLSKVRMMIIGARTEYNK
jgi:hypothetical protein